MTRFLKFLKYPALVVLALLAVGLGLHVLNPLPPLAGRVPSRAFPPSGDTPLGRGAARLAAGREGRDGLHLLDDGRAAFAARALLAREAVRSLDVQYYIWKGDLSGTLLLEELRRAADRGVRVRLLLDDNGIDGLDGPLAAFDRHPNVEVRLYNPFTIRRPKWVGFLADFPRLNRRMHNKSFTADGVTTIVGGRNVGDEYFGARAEGLFVDLDVLAVGPVAQAVSAQFDRYWNSASAYPAALILPPVSPARIAEIPSGAGVAGRDPAARAYLDAVRSLPIVARLRDGSLPLEWARVRTVADDPAKTLGKAAPGELLFAKLVTMLGRPRRDLSLVSGYFVPGIEGAWQLADLSRSGVRVSVLTNAFEATDVGVVHAGYAPRREALLRAGVELWEMHGGHAGAPATPTVLGTTGGSAGPGGSSGALRAGASTLHAKTFSIDGRHLFVGSFNFDPRSMRLNTELGFVIDSPTLAGRVERGLRARVPASSYEVRLDPDGGLVWLERTGAGLVRHEVEPGTNLLQRLGIALLSKLPIEWLL